MRIMTKLIAAAVTDMIVLEKARVEAKLYKTDFKITRYTITPKRKAKTKDVFTNM
jgi:hypothetical protein